MSFGSNVKPISNIIARVSTTRLVLRKGSRNVRTAKIYQKKHLQLLTVALIMISFWCHLVLLKTI